MCAIIFQDSSNRLRSNRTSSQSSTLSSTRGHTTPSPYDRPPHPPSVQPSPHISGISSSQHPPYQPSAQPSPHTSVVSSPQYQPRPGLLPVPGTETLQSSSSWPQRPPLLPNPAYRHPSSAPHHSQETLMRFQTRPPEQPPRQGLLGDFPRWYWRNLKLNLTL